MSQKIKTSVEIDGSLSASQIANATTDTDKFLVSDGGTVKYRTGAELVSDLGITVGTANHIQHQVKAGVAINKGQAVYVTSADGTNMIVGLASNASEATSSKTMGLLNATVAANGFADVITEGLLAGLNTIGANAGDAVWLGTGGNLIYGLTNKPYAPNHLVFIGIVTRVNANNGEIFVKVQNGFELDELHDVDLKTTTPVNGHILGHNGTLWVNKTISGWLGYTPYNASNPAGYISSYTETDTLSSVTGRGASTSNQITLSGGGDNSNTYSSLRFAGYNQGGGTGYHGFFELENTYSSGTNKKKFFRLDSSGTIQIINSAYTSNIFNLTDAGDLTVNKIIKSGGTSSQYLMADGSVSSGGGGGVTSFNTRTGAVTLTSGDVTGALGYTPYNSSNPNGYISSYTETSTLANVTARGATTTTSLTANSFIKTGGNGAQFLMADGTTSTNPGWLIGINSLMVTNALGYTPYNSSNPNGYISSYTETDTLATVTARGALTSGNIFTPVNGGLFFNGNGLYGSGVYGSGNDLWFNAGSTQKASLNSSGDFTANNSLRSPIFYDSNDTAYYVNPASSTRLNGYLSFGVPGNGANANGRWLSIEGNTDVDGEGSGRIFFTEHNSTTAAMDAYGLSIGYRGGATSLTTAGGNTWTGLSAIDNGAWGFWGHNGDTTGTLAMFGPRTGEYITATGSFRAPIFYDSNNTSYYGDFGSTGNSLYLAGQIYTTKSTGTLISINGVDTIGYNSTTGGAYLKGTGNSYIYGGGLYFDGSVNQTLIHTGNVGSYAVPTSRTITINGTSYDLSANRSWTVTASETDTLATVTGRGSTTSTRPSFDGGITVNGQSYVTANGYFVSGAQGFRWNDSSGNYNNVIMRDNGTTWFRNYLETPDSMRSPIYYDANDTGYYWNPATDTSHRFQTPSGYIDIGPKNSGTCHIYTDRPSFYFNKDLIVNGSTVLNTSNAPRAANSYLMFYEGFTLNANDMSTNSTGFTYSNNAPWTGPIARFSTGGGYDLWLNASYGGNGTGLSYRTRNGDAGTYNSWHRIYSDSYRPYADDSGTTGQRSFNYLYASSYLESGGAVYGTIFYDNNNRGYYMDPDGTSQLSSIYTNNWVRVQGDSGVYSQDYGGHLRRPVNASHGTWEIFGYNKNGYAGMNVYDPQGYNNNYMHESGNGGLYQQNGNGWVFYHHRGNACFGVMTSTTSSSYKLYVGGSIYAEGDIVAYSDRRKKENIVTVDNALNTVNKLRGVYYNRIDDDSKKRQIGVIAQEIQEVLPEVVTYAKDLDEYGVSYGNITGLLIEAIKEQQTQIEELKELVNKLINK